MGKDPNYLNSHVIRTPSTEVIFYGLIGYVVGLFLGISALFIFLTFINMFVNGLMGLGGVVLIVAFGLILYISLTAHRIGAFSIGMILGILTTYYISLGGSFI